MSNWCSLLLAHSTDLLLLVAPQSLRVLAASPEVTRVLGYSTEQLAQMVITDMASALEDVFYWDEVSQGAGEDWPQHDTEYASAHGELLPVNQTVQRIMHDSEVYFLVRATQSRSVRQVQDVLAQTLSQLRATLESTGNGILVLDAQGHISSMNRQFGAMWGLLPQSVQDQDEARILAQVADSVLEPQRVRERFAAILDPQDTLDVLQHRDGRVFEFGSRAQYLQERIVGRVFSVTDVTQRTLDAQALRESRDQLEARVQRRTAELNTLNEQLRQDRDRLGQLVQELESAQTQLVQSERMASIGQLAAGVAHEINNPVGFVNSNLGTLQLYVQQLLGLVAAYVALEPLLPPERAREMVQLKQSLDFDFLREDIAALLAESLDGLKRVTRIVQDLRNFSHADEGTPQLADLEEGLESTLRVVWNELKYKAEVVREFAGLPKILCHLSQLNQVFMNLLVNAVQAIEHHGRVTVRTGFDAQQVWVQVQDTGQGIAPEHLRRIFDPFFTTKPVGKGTGLGLSLSYSIVQKHQGHIEVESTPGVGTTFTVYLPRPPEVKQETGS
jgi:PAS domain S-box-containing protein